MFDFAWSEFALIGAVALIVIGPKDLPVAIRGVAKGVKKARALASELQSHLDEVVREADLSEVSEHMRDLKNLNVRGRIMKALDGDGSLSKAVSPPPLSERAAPAGPRALDDIPRSQSPTPDYAAAHRGIEPYGSAPAWQGGVQDEQVERAPPELPPIIVRRILREQDRMHPPAILPPVRILHAGQSVAPSIIPVVAEPTDNDPQPDPARTEPPQTGDAGAGEARTAEAVASSLSASVEPSEAERLVASSALAAPADTGTAPAAPAHEGTEQAPTAQNGTGSTVADQQA